MYQYREWYVVYVADVVGDLINRSKGTGDDSI